MREINQDQDPAAQRPARGVRFFSTRHAAAAYNSIMANVTVRDVKADLEWYLQRVVEGESFLVVRDDKPIAEIRPVPARPTQPRPIGLAKGTFTVPPEFFEPLLTSDEAIRSYPVKTEW